MYYRKFFWRANSIALLLSLVTACGGGGSSVPTPTIPSPTPVQVLNNVLGVTVDSGPVGTGNNVNRLYTAVKICQPGTSQCQTIDHMLVDTGSSGVRFLAGVLAPSLNLSRLTVGTSGLPLLNCVQFVDNTFAWGPVAKADIVLGGKLAPSVPIQLIADPAFNRPASACAVGGTAITTATLLGANGILGIGLFKEDCGSGCVSSSRMGFYYTCTDASCTATKGALASLDQQVNNPVPLFASDNNGVLIDLPAVGSAAEVSLNGSLIFGIGTQANNQTTSAGVLTTNALGYVTTLLAGQNLPNNFSNSFIDSGSNGLFFDSNTIAECGNSAPGFYCPKSSVNLSAKLLGANAATIVFSFQIDNATVLFTDASKVVLPGLAGPMGNSTAVSAGSFSTAFDWGLPFFYGRRVFFGIEGQAATLGTSTVTGPYYAF